MAKKFVKHIVLPDGTLVAIAMLSLIRHIPGKGLLCLDFRQKWVATIKIEDGATAAIAQKILNDIIQDPMHAIQPDWSFLTEEVAVQTEEEVVQAEETQVPEADASDDHQ